MSDEEYSKRIISIATAALGQPHKSVRGLEWTVHYPDVERLIKHVAFLYGVKTKQFARFMAEELGE